MPSGKFTEVSAQEVTIEKGSFPHPIYRPPSYLASDHLELDPKESATMAEEAEVKIIAKPPKIVYTFTKKLNVDAACVNGFGADPAPNLIFASVTDPDGRPVTGLAKTDFTLVNYAMTDGHARLVELRHVLELIDELPGAGIDGVYKIEPEQEPEITGQVGQTVYAVKVSKTELSPGASTYFSGQTVVSVVMQKKPW
jgi:hypothetical protein